jgi:hypothetical protein
MRAVDEGVRMTRCAGEHAAPCIPGDRCLTHGLWDALGEQITWFLESVTLEEVIGGIAPFRLGRGHLPGVEGRADEMGSDATPPPSVLNREIRREGSDPAPVGE